MKHIEENPYLFISIAALIAAVVTLGDSLFLTTFWSCLILHKLERLGK